MHLAPWGRGGVVERLAGGMRNDVFLVEMEGVRYVSRIGRRPEADLEWELDLLEALTAAGIRVPRIVPTRDGRRHVCGTVVMEFVEGRPPESSEDWRAVVAYLRQVHALGEGRDQRPGWASSGDLVTAGRSALIELSTMPDEAVRRCRAAWSRTADRPTTVVHGDPNPRNIRMTAGGVVMLDWDEARVDVPELDLAAIPQPACPLRGQARWAACQSSSAWEAASCWSADATYAQQRLAEVVGAASADRS